MISHFGVPSAASVDASIRLLVKDGKKYVCIGDEWREYTEQVWRGQVVFVTDAFPTPHAALCSDGQHSLSVMHHTDGDGRHHCPTGFLECSECGGVADDPDPQPCAWMRREA